MIPWISRYIGSRLAYIVAYTYASQTPDKDAPSALLELPAELRNLIYEYTLTAPDRLVLTNDTLPEQPALTRTCRQIRSECLPMFYEKNQFRYYCRDFSRVAINRWIDRIGTDNFKLTHTHNSYIQTGSRQRCVANLLVWL